MKLQNVRLQIVQNISIQNVYKLILAKNISNILIQTLCISDAHYIIAINVVSVGIQCRYCNASVVLRLFIFVVWTNKKFSNFRRNNLYVITISKIRKI